MGPNSQFTDAKMLEDIASSAALLLILILYSILASIIVTGAIWLKVLKK